MAGRISAAMMGARRLYLAGEKNVAEVARKSGITANSIYRSAWYKALKAAQK